jgi:hypothetical protein
MTEQNLALPEPGDQAEFWRRDKGGPSERVTVVVLETIPETGWCFVRRLDTGEERTIDPKRLRVVQLARRCPTCNALYDVEECDAGLHA